MSHPSWNFLTEFLCSFLFPCTGQTVSKATTGPPTRSAKNRSSEEVKTDSNCEDKIENVIIDSGSVEQCVKVCTITQDIYEGGVLKETKVETTHEKCLE